jgi:hypothetical protein
MKTVYTCPITGADISKEHYFNIMFGKDYMNSNDKGRIKEYLINNNK